MVTTQELEQQASAEIPQRRLGSRVTRQTQQQAIEKRGQAQEALRQAREEEVRQGQIAAERERRERLQEAIKKGKQYGLNREERQLVGDIKATRGRTAEEFARQQSAKPTAREEAEQRSLPEGEREKPVMTSPSKSTERIRNILEGERRAPVVVEELRQQSVVPPMPREEARNNLLGEKDRVGVSETPRASIEENDRVLKAKTREEERVIDKIRRSSSTSNYGIVRIGAGFAQGGYSFGQGIKALIATEKSASKGKKLTPLGEFVKERGTRFFVRGEETFPEIRQLLEGDPYYATGRIGFEVAVFKAPTGIAKTSDFFRTFGLKELPRESVIAKEFFEGQRYPKIKPGQTAGELLEEFKVPALPDEVKPAGFTASPASFPKSTEALPGSSEIPGLYQAPKLSPAFLRVETGEGFKLVGGNPLGTLKPTALRVTPESIRLVPGLKAYESVPNPSRIGEVVKFFEKDAPLGESFVTFIKTEKEAVIPAGTQLELVAKRYFFRFEGRSIPIFEFRALGEGERITGARSLAEVYASYYRPTQRALINPYSVTTTLAKTQEVNSYYKDTINSYKSYTASSSSYTSPSLTSYSPFSSSYSSYVKSYVSPSYTPPSTSITSYSSYTSTSTMYTPPRYQPYYPPYKPLVPRNPNARKYNNQSYKRQGEGLVKGYKTFVFKGGKKVFLQGVRPRGSALEFGEVEATRSLRATFGIEKVNVRVQQDYTKASISKEQFRGYKIQQGKRIPLYDTFIQRRGKRLSSGSEVSAIQEARKRYKI